MVAGEIGPVYERSTSSEHRGARRRRGLGSDAQRYHFGTAILSDPARKRWDRMTDRLADAGHTGQHRPPFPTIVADVIWLVFRVDPAKIAPYVPAELAVSLDLI